MSKFCECGKPSVFYKKYEGKAYCKSCFVKQVENNFKKTIGKDGLIEKNDKIAVALSGGKDSCLLIYLLNKIFRNKLFAIIVDEGIRGYREKGIEAGRNLCEELGIKYKIVSFKDSFSHTMDEIASEKQRPCTYCGVFKRYLLNKEARVEGATKLAVGINLDDEAESIIMNIIRGDIDRFLKLGSYPMLIDDKMFVPRIKPLRNLSGEEIMLYDKLKGIKFYSRVCPHATDSIRLRVRKIISELEAKYPGTKYQIVRFYDRLKPLIKINVTGKMKYCKKCGEPSSREICKACELLDKL
ncbi:MAG: TIGR00269 family protein [Candidatus Aenigmatarchaeota archaeon]